MTPIESWEKERTDAISEMFDNPDEDGIFPTTKFFNRIDAYFYSKLAEAYRKGREDACDYILRHWNDISEKTLDETRSNLFEEARHAGEEKDTRKSICNDCFDGDHIQCSQGPCECVCRAGEVSKEV